MDCKGEEPFERSKEREEVRQYNDCRGFSIHTMRDLANAVKAEVSDKLVQNICRVNTQLVSPS